MAKKILYLGNNKWCYTPNCSDHASLRASRDAFVTAIKSGDTEAAQKALEELRSTPEGTATFYQTQVVLFKEQNKRQPTIGLDVDGTSGGFTEGLREFLISKKSIHIPKEKWKEHYPDPETYDYHGGENDWFKDREEFQKHFFEAEEAGLYLKMPMYENASPVIKELVNYGFKVKVVTARRNIWNHHTAEWFKKHTENTFKIFNPGHAKESLPNIDVYMEDAPVVIERLLKNNKNVLIMDQKYNRIDFGEGNHDRTEGWSREVVDKIFNLILKKDK